VPGGPCTPVMSGGESPGELVIEPHLMQGKKCGLLTAKNGSPTEGPGFLGEEAEGDLVEVLPVVMAQCWLGMELVLNGGDSRKLPVAFAVCVGEHSPG